VLDVYKTAADSVAQQVFKGLSHARRCFARANHKYAFIAIEVIFFAGNDEASFFDAHVAQNSAIGIGRRDSGVKDRFGILPQLFEGTHAANLAPIDGRVQGLNMFNVQGLDPNFPGSESDTLNLGP
jgi:hypothetical protein